jgi:hypothetical protein
VRVVGSARLGRRARRVRGGRATLLGRGDVTPQFLAGAIKGVDAFVEVA